MYLVNNKLPFFALMREINLFHVLSNIVTRCCVDSRYVAYSVRLHICAHFEWARKYVFWSTNLEIILKEVYTLRVLTK
jgi:hypothetical protein